MANEMPWNAFQGNDPQKVGRHPLDIELERGGVVISPHSAYARELRKWDTPRSQGGMRPDGYEEYPLMLSKAFDFGTGKAEVHRMPPVRWAYAPGVEGDRAWDQACASAEAITRQCQRTVNNGEERERAEREGWVLGQDEALAKYERDQQAVGDAAAERAFSDQRMTELAKREADAADKATHQHVADVPVPAKKRGRPAKAPMVVVP